MKKLLMIFLLTAVLALSACARPSAPPQDTVPTPPSIQTSKTPLELLNEAVTNTQNAKTCTVQYGTITTTGDDKQETLYTQTLSPGHPLDWNTLYAQVPDFPTNENLLSDFCSGALRAIPSNTGTIRYERSELTRPEMDNLMHGQASETEDSSNVIGTAAIEVDADNRFARLEFIMAHYGVDDTLHSTVTIILSITFPA